VDPDARQKLDVDLARLAEGDRTAFDEVFATLWPIVLAVSGRLLVSRADAEDAAQQALMKVFTRIDEYDADRPALSWVLGIAAWECRAMRTRHARRREAVVDDAASVASGAPSPEDVAVTNEWLAAAAAAVAQLSPADQEAFREACEDRPNASDATLRKRRQRALGRLRIAWRKIYGSF
jgi:RNA polymerase sigma-70 factor (ECF subfamily)